MTAWTGSTAKSKALALVGKGCEAGACLKDIRINIFNIGSKYPSAISAWNGAVHKSTAHPPAGFVGPVFFHTASPYRHVAVAIGDGRVVTINGSVWSIYSSIDSMAKIWGAPYMGYSRDLNGVTLWTPPAPKPTYTNITALQKAVGGAPDNVWGPDSNKRLNAIRSASAWKGGKFPYGVRYTQGVVGTKVDGVWGKNSDAAHDKAVKAIQKAVGVTADGVYGSGTDAAVKKKIAGAKKS